MRRKKEKERRARFFLSGILQFVTLNMFMFTNSIAKSKPSRESKKKGEKNDFFYSKFS